MTTLKCTRFAEALLAGCVLLTGCQPQSGLVIAPRARAVSQPVAVNEVQDAAIWIHPTDPAKSLLLITNEKRGLEVHDLGGLLLKHVDNGIEPCYVDIVYEFSLKGRTVDLALASCMAPDSAGVRVWQIDPASRKLLDVTAGRVIEVLDGRPPVGLCAYHSRKTGKSFVFVTLREGPVEQYELFETPEGRVSGRRVRQFALAGEVKSCMADDEFGVVYVAEDDVGVWRFPAEPDAAPKGTCVIKVGENGLVPNAKGPAIYHASGGRGYLLVVSQGSKGAHTCVKVYERGGDNRFLLTIDPSPAGFGALDHCSGLAVANQPTIAQFPQGVLALNDQINPNASEDFKLYCWGEIARMGGLLIDTTWSPRPSRARR
ncbi:MAG: phytase [Planctomycetes bacterium]|nr:phytase [Planctomycetota bacterium]